MSESVAIVNKSGEFLEDSGVRSGARKTLPAIEPSANFSELTNRIIVAATKGGAFDNPQLIDLGGKNREGRTTVDRFERRAV